MANKLSAEQKLLDEPWRDANATPFISIEDVSKSYGDFVAVNSANLQIYKGELFSILGASGCGKTTLLRMLAGFESPSGGRILIDGVDLTDVPPYKRPVNMMFQSYAIFPHMTVHENVAYGLRKERLKQPEINKRVAEMLELVQLSDYAKRKPRQLSGGERQRVALARALIKRPKVLLLDEPLAALDKKLRERTQFELMNIQDELGITFIVVTHDQEEAMILSSRIAIMEHGGFLQVGAPKEVYEYPTSRYVADFIGTINLLEGTVDSTAKGELMVSVPELAITPRAYSDLPLRKGDAVCVAIRPEKIYISQDEPDDSEKPRVAGVIEDFGYLGNLSLYRVRLASGKIILVSAQNRRRSKQRFFDWDEEVFISWRAQSAVVLTE